MSSASNKSSSPSNVAYVPKDGANQGANQGASAAPAQGRGRSRPESQKPRGGQDSPEARAARDLARAAREAEKAFRNPLPPITYPEDLPVSGRREEIAKAFLDNQVSIVSGETGSGKTTQLPKICLELGRGQSGMIGHTQPRRIAASSTAKRIAQDLGRPSASPSVSRCASPTRCNAARRSS